MDGVIQEQTEITLDVDETWTKLRDTVYKGALDVQGTTKRKHRDWFNENVAKQPPSSERAKELQEPADRKNYKLSMMA